ncbi:hypothetical protein CPB83DRAFT_910024, partial [Crepidotus variabilis]
RLPSLSRLHLSNLSDVPLDAIATNLKYLSLDRVSWKPTLLSIYENAPLFDSTRQSTRCIVEEARATSYHKTRSRSSRYLYFSHFIVQSSHFG